MPRLRRSDDPGIDVPALTDVLGYFQALPAGLNSEEFHYRGCAPSGCARTASAAAKVRPQVAQREDVDASPATISAILAAAWGWANVRAQAAISLSFC